MDHLQSLTPARAAYLHVALGLTGDPAILTLLAQRCIYNAARADMPAPQLVNDLVRYVMNTPPRLRLTIHTLPDSESAGSVRTIFQAQTVSGTLHLLGSEQRHAIPLEALSRSCASEALAALAATLDPASPGALPETKSHFAAIERRELRPDQRTLHQYAGDAELGLAYRPGLVVGTIILCTICMVRDLAVSDADKLALLRDATSVFYGDLTVSCHNHAPSNEHSRSELKELAMLVRAYLDRCQTLGELYETVRIWRLRQLTDMLPQVAHARTIVSAQLVQS